jgi:hypothetical protein
MEENIEGIFEDEEEFLELYQEIGDDAPLDFFTEAFSDSENWEDFLDILHEASNIGVAKKHGVATAKKYKKLKDKLKTNTNITVSVDKSGKVVKKKKDKTKGRKMARILKQNRRKGKSQSKKSTEKTKKSSLYKRLNKEEIAMEDITTYDPSEDISALFDGEDLSEEFKSKASAILEAAVNSNVKKVVDQLVEKEEEQKTEDEQNESITEQVDKYLNYVVEEWMEENKLSVEQGIRYELSEQFITGLKTLFKESYIDIPEEKVDVVSELTTQVEKLKDDLNEERKFAVDLKETLQKFTKESIVSEITEKLVDTESVKIKELSESIEFVSEEDYKEKVESLKESYFPSTKKVLTEENEVDEEPVQQTSGAMGVYTSTLDRIL